MAHGDRFVVPAAITIEHLEDTKRGVCALLPHGTKYEDWYPPLVLSYASGRRTNRKGVADDCDGSGPGVMYAKGLMEFLHERGLQCFSGLQVPAGVDWETFMLRLTGENGKREKPKVLIIILTAGLFHSKPCLKEIDTAIKNKIALLPVRFEDNLPAKEEQWTNLDDPDWEMMKFHVQAKLNKLNNIPNPGTVLNRPTSLQDIVAAIQKHLPAPASTATPKPPPKPSGGPSDGPRFPVGSRLYVDQGHGKESLGVVMTYNAAKGAYVVELGERGSGELDTCFDQDLRKADGPLSQLIDSAREGAVSLFGIDPMIMEREGATMGSAAATMPTPQQTPTPAKPTPQPPPSPAKPVPQPPAQPFKAPKPAPSYDRPSEQVKNFRGPCADCCKPLAPCCCVSADGEAIFCCVPTEPGYFLPACLHMALCPQLGCDPRGGHEWIDDYFKSIYYTLMGWMMFFPCFQGDFVW
jgi:hypothetical protein